VVAVKVRGLGALAIIGLTAGLPFASVASEPWRALPI